MNNAQSPDVVQFRIDRMRRAPRNWCYWVAVVTAVNGFLAGYQSDTTFLVGFVAPYLVGGVWAHLAIAIIVAALGHFGQRQRGLYIAALVAYVLDALLATGLQLWSGLVMHIVVLAFVAIALNGARILQNQLSQRVQQPVQSDS